MKNGKIIFAGLLLSILTCNALQAQEKKAAAAGAEKKELTQEQKEAAVAKIQEQRDRLALTKEQQVPYRETIKRYAMLARDVRGSALTPDEKKAKLKTLMGEKDAEMKTLLTADQYKTYTEIQEERKAKFVNMKNK